MENNEKRVALAAEKDVCEATQRAAKRLHADLFPEEYDHVFDSISEAKERLGGINPVSAEHIEKTTAYRAQLGFAPFQVGPGAQNDDTFAWVLEKLQRGQQGELQHLAVTRAKQYAEAEKYRETARQKLQTPSWRDQRIDEMLASSKFADKEQGSDDPNVIAFRILGELFEINKLENNEAVFLRQIRRVVPNRSETEYRNLFRHAMNEWVAAYGY